jgi:predicted nucleotidyltransferase component of viral defense system
MKEHALMIARGASDSGMALNLLREYLQAFVLRALHEHEAFRSIAFVGGTALRFLHGLPRFSEDLDFSLEQTDGYDGKVWMAAVKRELTLAGFDPEVTWNDRKTVHTAWVRLAGILNEAGLSALPEQKLSIKLEIDTHPPAGAYSERRVITRHLSFLLRHYDLPSLLAGKLHALMTRKFAKGRDWYDLLWYLSQRPAPVPNVIFLQNALDQTQGAGTYDATLWRELVGERLQQLDMQAVRNDILPFLERTQDAELLNRDYLNELLR